MANGKIDYDAVDYDALIQKQFKAQDQKIMKVKKKKRKRKRGPTK